MATEATFFGLFHNLIQILIAWSIISNLAFHTAIDLTISFNPIQLGAMKTLFVTKSLLPEAAFLALSTPCETEPKKARISSRAENVIC